MDDYSGAAAGIGIGVLIFGFLVYIATLALALWIGYLIMRTAVKNGILRADAERARMHPAAQHGAPPTSPPGSGYSQ
ncbi:hypothetical protein ACTU6U_01715 [Microbacterium sp. A196]|uniref:hypothetical protein n=1 Tax=Microbacterium sp. A196 TaxID=3457320 RepID=UPI003FCF9831